jgi:dienelactone hydrolase
MLSRSLCALMLLLSVPALAKVVTKKVAYEVDKTKFEGVLIYDDAGAAKPGLVLVPNWLGINEANLKQAAEVADRGYVVFVADVFGLTGRPKTMEEAGKASGALKADRPLLRKRMKAAYDQLVAQKSTLDPKKLGTIGFCFGGLAALELARSGARLGGVVTFHAGLSSPTPADAKNITGRVMALHGADDPYESPEEVKGFQDEMRNAKLDWQFVAFGNTVHSFTDVDAHMPGQAEYNEKSAKRAYQMMDNFFAETFH